MKTTLIVLFAVVAFAVGANINRDALERAVRDTSVYEGAAQADAGARGDEATAQSAVVDQLKGTVSAAGAAARRGVVSSSSSIGKFIVHNDD